jgi:hypothetical protein
MRSVRSGLLYINSDGRLCFQNRHPESEYTNPVLVFIDLVRTTEIVWMDKSSNYYVCKDGSTITHSDKFDHVHTKENSAPANTKTLLDRKTFWDLTLSDDLEFIAHCLFHDRPVPKFKNGIVLSSVRSDLDSSLNKSLVYTGFPDNAKRVFMTPTKELVALTKTGTLKIMYDHDNTRNRTAEFFLMTSVGIVCLMNAVVVFRIVCFILSVLWFPLSATVFPFLGYFITRFTDEESRLRIWNHDLINLTFVLYDYSSATWADVLMPWDKTKTGLIKQLYINRIIHGYTQNDPIVELDHHMGIIGIVTDSGLAYLIRGQSMVKVRTNETVKRLWITTEYLVMETVKGSCVVYTLNSDLRTSLVDELRLSLQK